MDQMKYNCKGGLWPLKSLKWGFREGGLGCNHYEFTALMMGRELIYPGGKQIMALLSPALRHTIAYINILSWVIQVSKGLVHLHLHKGPLSTLWPLAPLLLMRAGCPLLHLTVFLLSLSSPSSRLPRSHAAFFSACTWTPTVSSLLFSSCNKPAIHM